ncbi:siderophore ABC transporter substrate-binding protein [uncultured Thalassospira sp.]|uniref:siderophore ABC transporter substrate-binding protein n=1 Tax=uncultured Thalassospira sp. TaxID=404382 RepID=UPI00258A62F0|nr:siderophore ABC transporter substrate-binding protein [uncultured Thalassospira sp.]
MSLRSIVSTFCGLLLVAFSVAGAPAYADGAVVTVAHAQGETDVPLKPRTVLTFDLSALDTLNVLEEPVEGIPEIALPEILAQFGELPKIGSMFEPDFEAINAMEPDLIIISGRAAPKFAELSAMAPTIDLTVRQDHFLADVFRNIRVLGTIFDKPEKATAEIEGLKESMASLQALSAKVGNGLLIMTNGARMSTYGPNSRFGILFNEFGVVPADENIKAGNHGQPVSFEYILETDPDWLFVIDRDSAIGQSGAAAEALLDNDLIHQTSAWKKDQIVYLDSASWYLVNAGIESLHRNIKQLAQRFVAVSGS